MPEGYPTLESQVPYYVAVKDQGTEGAEPSVPSRLALRKNHYIESPGGERSHLVIRTPSEATSEINQSKERNSTWSLMPHVMC